MLTGSKYYIQRNCFGSTAMALKAESLGQLPPHSTSDTQRGARQHAALQNAGNGNLESFDESDAVEKVKDKADRVAMTFGCFGQNIKTRREERFYLRDGLRPIYSGQPDVVYQAPNDFALFQDYKPGFEEEWPMWYDQRTAYAVLIHAELGITDIVGQIVPRYGKVDSVTFAPVNLYEEKERLLYVIDQHNKPSPELTPGPWCKYCQGRLICERAYKPVIPSEFPAITEALPAGEAGAELIERLTNGIKLAKEILALYKKKIADDQNYVGGAYTVGDDFQVPYIEAGVEASLKLAKYLSVDEQAGCATFWPGKVRDKLREKYKLPSDKEASEMLANILGDLLRFDIREGRLAKAKKLLTP